MAGQEESIREVRNFVTLHRVAVLSTLSKSLEGYPFGSIVPYDVDDTGRLVIFIANISEHFRNLTKDPRACMFIADYYGLDDPQAHSRASLIGDFEQVPESEVEAVARSYWGRFPDAIEKEISHTFLYFRFQPKKIRWIGGFGDIRWIPVPEYQDGARDPVAYSGIDILDHMNTDHRNALVDLVHHHGKCKVTPDEAIMNGVDSDGFSIAFGTSGKRKRIRISFPHRAENPADVRKLMIDLLKECRAK